MASLSAGICYKSHDYPPTGPSDAKFVYVFGDPIDATISAYQETERHGQRWLDEHCDHLRIPHVRKEDLFDRDALRLGEHVSAWRDRSDLAVAFVRFETIWHHIDELSSWLGFQIRLPPHRERLARHDLRTVELADTYSVALSAVSSLKDFQLSS